MGSIPRYLRHAARTLAGNPGFTGAGILTLALGVGATTAVFSVAEPLLARRLPVIAPEELVLFRTVDPAQENGGDRIPDEFFDLLTSGSRTLSGALASLSLEDVSAPLDLVIEGEGPDNAEPVRFEFVTGSYFGVLGLEPAAGRLLTESDDDPGAEPVAVISYPLWQRRFGGSVEAVDTRISLENPIGFGGFEGVRVVGVAPPGFYGTNIDVRTDLWLTFQIMRPPSRTYRGGLPGVRVIGRARGGVNLEDVQAEIDVLSGQLTKDTRAVDHTGSVNVRVEPGDRGYSDLRVAFYDPILALGAAAGLVLLIVWTNLAALMLTRGIARRREMAVRLALGSGQGGIIGHFLAEGLLLTSAGGLLGWVFARWGTMILTAFLPPDSGFLSEGGSEGRIFLFAAVVSLLGVLIFAILPGLRISRMAITSSMKSSGSRTGRMASSFTVQRVIVGAQIAVAFLLLAGAGLFLRTLGNLRSVDIGFDPGSLIEFEIEGSLNGVEAFSSSGLERIAALPGVVSTTAYDQGGQLGGTRVDLVASGPAGSAPNALEVHVGRRYFETMRIPLISGELFPDSTQMFWGRPFTGLMVSESLADRLFGGQSPIGQDITFGGIMTNRSGDDSAGEYESGPIVGVVGDVKHDGPREQSPLAVYYPGVNPGIPVRPHFAVRTEGAAADLVAAIRQAVQESDGNLRVANIHTLLEARDALIAPERFVTELATFFGVASMILASIGMFGVLWNSVTQRTAEIGVRMALGAQQGAVIRMFIKEVAWVVGFGVASGVLAALVGTRLVSNLLFGVMPADATSFLLAALTLVATSFVAAWLPARRASRIDPLVALGRED